MPHALLALVALAFAARVSSSPLEDPDDRAQRLLSSGRFLVRVLDGETHAPVAGAEVRWKELELARTAFGLRHVEDVARHDELFADVPALGTTDADGYAELDRPARAAVVRVTAPGRFGSARFTGASGLVLRLDVLPDWDLPVVVVDRDGKPAPRLPVCLRRERGGLFVNETSVTTDAQGRATLPHVGYRVRADPDERGARWYAGLAILAREPVHAPIATDAPPRTPVRLVAPPMGALELTLGDALGRDVGARLPVEFSRARENGAVVMPFGDAARPWDGSAFPLDVVFVEATPDGRVVLPHVGLGLELQAGARRDAGAAPTVVRFDGPARAGEHAGARLEFGRDHPTFTGRLFDEQGRALADAEVTIALITDADLPGATPESVREVRETTPAEEVFATARSVRCDTEGRFVLDYETTDARAQGKRLVVLGRRSDSTATSERAWSSATVSLDTRWLAGVHELGDVRLSEGELLAEGRVRERKSGNALADVQIGLWTGHGVIPLGKSGFDGAFRVRGPVLGSAFALRFALDGHETRVSTNVVLGERELAIELEAVATLALRFVLPAGFDAASLAAVLTIVPDERALGWNDRDVSGRQTLDELGRATFTRLTPGVYELCVGAFEAYGSDEFFQWRGSIEDGRTTLIERDFTARDALRTIEVYGPDGAPVSGLFYATRGARGLVLEFGSMPGVFRPRVASEFHGSIRMLPGARLEIASPGLRSKVVDTETTYERVDLDRGLPVTLELDAPIAEVPEGWKLTLGVWSRDEPDKSGAEPPRLRFESEPFDATGHALWLAPGRGRYWVEWILEDLGPKPRALRLQDRLHPIRVGDLGTPQSIRVVPLIDPARVDFETLTLR
ncbi:MAG: hypothetical protein HZA53_04365 [Planctomycetes bacterium]|nr:hypothetical protein [Planctomycetota bacterium]